ncbi:MAG: DUF523 domain-containing protein [Sarcina sp.]
MIIVSACLCGVDCKYSGGNNKNENVLEFLKDKDYEMICPEEFGGLPTPRVASEIVLVDEKRLVKTKEGLDVTKEFYLGAEKSLEIAKSLGATLAILKARSPSCGNLQIYDGSFTGTLKKGIGITAELFILNNIEVISEEDLENRL